MNIVPIAIGVVAVVGVLLFFARLAKGVGVECVFCGGRSLQMDQLPEDERKKLLHYFKEAEKRVPVASHVYVCFDCHKVNDDCITRYDLNGMTIVCKSCGHTTNLDRRMVCNHCGARFEWVTFEDCGDYRFLLPVK